MKMTCILLLLACLQVSAKGFGQGIVTIALKDVVVNKVFAQIEKQTAFRFIYNDETIDVKGRVLNELGEPVEEVTATMKGTDKSAFTNSNGEFLLSNVEKDAVLVFTSEKMERFELKVNDKKKLEVRLKTNVIEGELSKQNNLIQIFLLIIISTNYLFQHFKLIAKRKAGILYPRIIYIYKL